MIGIIGAMELEIARLREMMDEKKEEQISGVRFTVGSLFGRPAVLAVCGIGKTFAALCAQTMILRYNPEMIINVGVAGTLTDGLSIGDMAIGSFAVCHDMDTSPLGDPVGLISGINMVEIPLDGQMREAFEECCEKEGVRHLSGVIASGDQFVDSGERKAWIRNTFSAIACEMEGQAIAQVCYVNRKPCAILRSISDSADGTALDYERFKELAAEHSTAVLARFLRSEEYC
ncbi:MAG: 5'-methylthioadenosine/adenosylhomocysteine nucleosidase [Clostridia bacterium]|nr:5'-methylthioadenosine/adenosylhomocysteine nucleosidase [Clostridia bacterium]